MRKTSTKKYWMTFGVIAGLSLGAAITAQATGNNPSVAPDFEFAKGLKKPFQSEGSAKQIQELQKNVVKLFESNYELGNLTPSEQKKLGRGESLDLQQNLLKKLSSVWTPEQAEENYKLILDMYRNDDGNSPDNTFDKVVYVVDDWQAADISSDTARILFVGHSVTKKNGLESFGSKTQWDVSLIKVNSASGWLISKRSGVSVDGH